MDSDVHVWYTWLYWQNWAAGTELAAKIAIGSSREIAPLSKVRDCKTDYSRSGVMQRLLNRWTVQLDLGCTTGGLERAVLVHNST